MKLAIVGSRMYPCLDEVAVYVRALPLDTVIVSGGAAGVDSAAAYAAHQRGMGTIVHHADWTTYGKRAGYLRNEFIVRDCDALVAFWDGQSRGTAHTVELAKKAGKPVQIRLPGGAK